MREKLRDGSGMMLRALMILAATFFVMIIFGGTLAAWVGSLFTPASREMYLAQSVVQTIFVFIAAALISAWIISRRPFSFLGMSQRVSWRPFVGVVCVYILGIPFLNQLIYWNSQMSLPESMAGLETTLRGMEEMNGKVSDIILSTDSVGGLLAGILIVGLLTGLGEEMLFRGMLQRSMSIYSRMGQWAIWIAAVIFSAVHMQFFGFFPRLLLGAFFGYLLFSTGSLWPSIFAHALNNSIVVVTCWSAVRNGSIPEPDMLWVVKEGFPLPALVSIISTVLFLIFCYKWFFINITKEESDGR